MFNWFTNRVQALKAAFARRMTTQIIERELRLSHAQELAHTPGNEWAIMREQHAREIEAVRDGNITVVDRRSWQWPYLPSSLSRIRQPIVKMTPYNIRRFMKSPVPRRCMNLIKNSITSLDWDIVPVEGTIENASPETIERIAAAKRCFEKPNLLEDFQTFMEIGIDDMLTFGAFVCEPQITPDPKRPIKMWVVDSSTIRIYPTWRESDADEPHYAQMTGLRGERGIIVFYDDELMYLRDNPSIETPFGLGRGEIAFQSVNALIGVQEMASRAGADQTHRTWLWWEGASYGNQVEVIRRHLTNDLEGQSKINIQTGMKPPQVIDVQPTTEEDLLLNWQELLMRMIPNAFDLSPLNAGVERDVNRSTGEVLEDKDFRSAVVPVATKLASGFTRFILHRKLGWTDIKFEFSNLDDPDTMTKMTIQTQLYTDNAQTPNGIRAAMGMPKLTTPLADLTQAEYIIYNEQVTSQLQDQNAAQQFGRQQTAQQQMMEQYGDQNQEDSSQGDRENNQGGNKGEQQEGAGLKVPSIKPPSLKAPMTAKPPSIKAPKSPMVAGVSLSGQQLAALTPTQLKAAQQSGLAPAKASDVKNKISQAGQSILISMSKELRQYLDLLEKEEEGTQNKEHPEPSAKDYEDQKKRFAKSKHKQSLIEKTVYNTDKDGLPKTRKGQGTTPAGLGKEVPNFVSDPRVSHPRPSRKRVARRNIHDN